MHEALEIEAVPGRRATACLINPRTGSRYELPAAVTTIGRSAQITIGDPFLSRQHARIVWHDQTYWFVDLDSANGSFINARKVSGPHRLVAGDLLQMGTTALSFMLGAEPREAAHV